MTDLLFQVALSNVCIAVALAGLKPKPRAYADSSKGDSR